jgi:hypothetical protein
MDLVGQAMPTPETTSFLQVSLRIGMHVCKMFKKSLFVINRFLLVFKEAIAIELPELPNLSFLRNLG